MSNLISCNPVTNKEVGVVEITPQGQLDQIFMQAHKAFKLWACMPFEDRLNIIQKFSDLLADHQEALANLIALETGKALWDSTSEVKAAMGKLSHSLKAVTERTPLETFKPIGVMGVLGPYNFPLHLPNGHIIPALLSGNVVIFKPSEKTPMVASYMHDLWQKAGLPNNVLQVIYGYGDLGSALVEHPKVNGILFTGGEKTGLAIHKSLAGRPEVMLALELGGNNPLVIWEPDDLENAVQIALYSAFISGGQRCSCARRLIIPDDPKIMDMLVEMTQKIRIDQPFADIKPFYSSLIDEQAVRNAHDAVNDLIQLGGDFLYRGETDLGTTFMAPAIVDVTNAKLLDDEIFAPVLKVIRVKNFDQALEQANKTRFGLSSGIITKNMDLWNQFKRFIKAGIVNLNAPTVGASGAAPFGGVGRSGNFRPAGFFAADYCAYPMAHIAHEDSQPILEKFMT